MTTKTPTRRRSRAVRDAVVWIDHENAVLVEDAERPRPTIAVVGREPGETEQSFAARLVHEVREVEHVAVSGPAFARTAFEREYVAVTHRPDRLVDVEPTLPEDGRTGRRPRSRRA